MWHQEPDALAPDLAWLPRPEALAEEGGSHGRLGEGTQVRAAPTRSPPPGLLRSLASSKWIEDTSAGTRSGAGGRFITLLGLTKKSRDQSGISARRTNGKGVPLRGAPRGV